MSEERLRAVESQLSELNGMLPQYMKRQDEALARLSKVCERHAYWIDGNGKPGAKVQMDRNTQDLARIKMWGKILAVPVIGLIVSQVWAAVSG